VCFRVIRADIQTDKETYTSQYFTLLLEGDAITTVGYVPKAGLLNNIHIDSRSLGLTLKGRFVPFFGRP